MKTVTIAGNGKKSPQSVQESASKVRAVLRELVEVCPHPARLLELYYWSAEPDLLRTLQRYIGLPDQPREALRAFLTMVADCPESVRVHVSRDGEVTLSSPTIARLMNNTDASRRNTDQVEPPH